MIPTTIPTARTIAHACPFLFSVASVTSEDKPVKTYFMFIVTNTLISLPKDALNKRNTWLNYRTEIKQQNILLPVNPMLLRNEKWYCGCL